MSTRDTSSIALCRKSAIARYVGSKKRKQEKLHKKRAAELRTWLSPEEARYIKQQRAQTAAARKTADKKYSQEAIHSAFIEAAEMKEMREMAY